MSERRPLEDEARHLFRQLVEGQDDSSPTSSIEIIRHFLIDLVLVDRAQHPGWPFRLAALPEQEASTCFGRVVDLPCLICARPLGALHEPGWHFAYFWISLHIIIRDRVLA